MPDEDSKCTYCLWHGLIDSKCIWEQDPNNCLWYNNYNKESINSDDYCLD